MDQISISSKKMEQLREILKPRMDAKPYNIKKFLKNNGLDPAYMNFYKFIKEEDFPLPNLGLLKILLANGYNIQLCITKPGEEFDDSETWEEFLNGIKDSVQNSTKIIVEKNTKTRTSSNLIISSINQNTVNKEEEFEISNLILDLYD